MSRPLALLLLLGVPLLWSACGKGSSNRSETGKTSFPAVDTALAVFGKKLFDDRNFGKSGLACSDCHSECDEAVPPLDRIYPGHSIVGAAGRTQAWNGIISGDAMRETAAGTAICAVRFLKKAKSPAEALSHRESKAFLAFFAAISTGKEPDHLAWRALVYPGDTAKTRRNLEQADERVSALTGNAPRGAVLFRNACSSCHGEGKVTGLAPSLSRSVMGRMGRIIRAGKGAMPFFSMDRLSDQDIADIIAHVRSSVQ
ncbi:MAG: cytochrome c [Bacteroidota bacterium]|nr:cytochrome c [Bacteroidota bacterium]